MKIVNEFNLKYQMQSLTAKNFLMQLVTSWFINGTAQFNFVLKTSLISQEIKNTTYLIIENQQSLKISNLKANKYLVFFHFDLYRLNLRD